MYIASCLMNLGYTRVQGVQVYNTCDKSFPLITPARARKLIDSGELKGILWVKNAETDALEFIPDKEGWNLSNIVVQSGLTHRLWKETVGQAIQNSIYSVVRVIEDGDKALYEVISNSCQRIKLTDVQLVGLADITEVGGVIINDGEIRVLDGVIIEKRQPTVTEQDEDGSQVKKPKTSRRDANNVGAKTSSTKKKPITKKK